MSPKPAVGDALPTLTKPAIDRLQLVKYAGASGDFNPIHVVEEFARGAGYPGVFAHGMLVMGFGAEFARQWIATLEGAVLRELSSRFTAITWPGDTITCRGTVTAVEPGEEGWEVTAEFEAVNAEGERKLAGRIAIRLAGEDGG